MDAPPHTSLESLPDDIQHRILSRIPCGLDRARMSLVCRAWRAMLHGHQAQPPLPWLLLPAAFPDDGSTRLACAICDSRVHHYLTIGPRGARCFGSHDGAWLLLQYRDRQPLGDNFALNVRTGHAERLPTVLLTRDGLFNNMVILAAALSTSPDDASCIGAAIVDILLPGHAPNAVPVRRLGLALWRRGWALAHELVPPEDDAAALFVDDVVYRNGAFHMLTQANHIRVCEPTIEHQHDGDLANWDTRQFQFPGRYDHLLHARYLVESRGEWLLVLRFTPQPNQPTSKFMVFREAAPLAWSELDTLGGRILFLGHGCSRSYEVDQHPGLKDGIYFLDDGEFYDAQVIFGVGNARRYPCSDNGKWRFEDGRAQRCFPMPHPSDHSAPAWLLP